MASHMLEITCTYTILLGLYCGTMKSEATGRSGGAASGQERFLVWGLWG